MAPPLSSGYALASLEDTPQTARRAWISRRCKKPRWRLSKVCFRSGYAPVATLLLRTSSLRVTAIFMDDYAEVESRTPWKVEHFEAAMLRQQTLTAQSAHCTDCECRSRVHASHIADGRKGKGASQPRPALQVSAPRYERSIGRYR